MQRECKTTPQGTEYKGYVSKTKSGKTCQAWDSQSPHQHHLAAKTEGQSNWCRNPDGEPEGPWCYTTDPGSRWEYCTVPTCPGPEVHGN